MINKVKFNGFEDFKDTTFEFVKGLNIVIGDNCMGKSDILDIVINKDHYANEKAVEVTSDSYNVMHLDYFGECNKANSKHNSSITTQYPKVTAKLEELMKKILNVAPEDVIVVEDLRRAKKSVAIQKLSILYKSLISRSFDNDLVLVFEDIDCGISSKYMKDLAELMHIIVESGIQLFLVSQNYFLLSYLELTFENNDNIKYFFLNRKGENILVQGESKFLLTDNNYIVKENKELYNSLLEKTEKAEKAEK